MNHFDKSELKQFVTGNSSQFTLLIKYPICAAKVLRSNFPKTE